MDRSLWVSWRLTSQQCSYSPALRKKRSKSALKLAGSKSGASRFLACGVDVHTEDASIGEHLGVFEDGALCLGASMDKRPLLGICGR